MDCLDFLCDGCSAAHVRTRFTRNHLVAPISEVVSGNKDVERKRRYRLPCDIHPDKPLTVYCVPCSQVKI